MSIEDDSGRLDLEISNACSHFRAISGVCLSLLGCEHEDGVFYVEDFAYPGFAPSICRSKLSSL